MSTREPRGIGGCDTGLLSHTYPITPPEHRPMVGTVPGGVSSTPSTITPPSSKSKASQVSSQGFFARFFDTLIWLINGLYDLIFSCFTQPAERSGEEIARGVTIPTIIDKWFPSCLKLGKHLEAEALIEDLKAVPEPVFHAIAYAFHDRKPVAGVTVEVFVNDFVMKVDHPREIQEALVVESLKKLSSEEFAQVQKGFFVGKPDPGPLSVEQFVARYVMKQKLGNRLHAGHLIEDLQALPTRPKNVLLEVYKAFFQGVPGAPDKLEELSSEAFVNDHVVMKPGAMARLKAALQLQVV